MSPGNAEMLLAVKWIGNDGSHDADLTVDDVVEAAEMVEHVLKQIFDESKPLKTRAQAINRSKGRVSRK